jgi:hypothetical protein
MEFLRVQFWVHFFYFISMIYRTAYNTLLHACSPTILTSQCPVHQLGKLRWPLMLILVISENGFYQTGFLSTLSKRNIFWLDFTPKSVYYGLIQPHFDYCMLWSLESINRGQCERLQKLHNRCARILMNFKDEPA